MEQRKYSKAQLAEMLKEQARREKEKLYYKIFPEEGPLSRHNYPRHMEFIESTSEYTECGFISANQIGKTLTAAFIMTAATTGDYHDWWNGKVWDGPVNCWAAGDTNETVRNIIQEALLGPADHIGSGMVPGKYIDDIKKKAGSVANAVESFTVKHIGGGYSHIGLKAYEQKRKSFQGTKKHLIWLDEEPPEDIYSECFTRTANMDGIIICTFTPLSGISDIVLAFMEDVYGDHRE